MYGGLWSGWACVQTDLQAVLQADLQADLLYSLRYHIAGVASGSLVFLVGLLARLFPQGL